ncbi:amino acid ABC transporter substrate-binding protein, PAAT family [Hathewaya proteolytica DSM 3090]|uniref:Amino acid ABC transporter substrate-binding protein, PAAT family n=1 Tax=Hathewaya proteolytica DSM 3090 TaxID=1121331 RepID=A0A1M6KK87_9CLOT|nr:transporter substrate-binding domain-containing protein [Hathewaya proteolytica]SHJ59398.1 amino acid ABC transporter substrate-binding protein, PAAT family [Hathewaya proteolytica DSM 3090]
MKKIVKLLSLILVISMLSLGVFGCEKKDSESSSNNGVDKSWDNVKKKGKITVGMCAMYPPFEYRNSKNGEIEGFDLDMMRAIAKEIGVEVEFKDAEYVSLIGGVEKGDYDLLASGMFRENLAEGNVQGSDTYYNINTVAVVLEENNDIKKLSDLEGKVIGVQSGTYAEKLVDSKVKNVKEIKRYNYSAEAFTDLKAKRIDSLVVGHTFATDEIKKKGKYVKIVEEPLGTSEMIIMTKKGNNELNKKLNEGLAKIKSSGELEKIAKKWADVE